MIVDLEFTEEQNLEFDFGSGPVPAHNHPKGGGLVADTAHVDEECYVGPYAMVYENAKVTGKVRIDGYAKVFGQARVEENAKVYGEAQVFDNAFINRDARVSGKSIVREKAIITDFAMIYDNAEIFGEAKICNRSEIYENAKVFGDAHIINNTKLYHDCVATRQPVVVTGLVCSITISDHHISAGCVSLAPEIWKKHGKLFVRALIDMADEDRPKTISEEWINALLEAARLHGCIGLKSDLDVYSENSLVVNNYHEKKTVREMLERLNTRTNLQ